MQPDNLVGNMDLRLSKRPCMHMEVIRGRNQMTNFDGVHPLVLHHILDGAPLLWIRLQHLAD